MGKNSHLYKDYDRRYKRRVKRIFLCTFLFVVCTVLSVGFAYKNAFFCVILFVVGIVCMGSMFLIQRVDDAYISDVVLGLSDLLDVLTELEERQVFPDNEDTLVSKLQSKIAKLVRILKLKSEKEQMEHENIKGLVSDLSHQLKTPISNLKIYTEFLKKSDLSDEERKEYIKVLDFSVERLCFLAESMIKVSRLESGLIHLDMQRQSINQTVLEAVKAVYANAKAHGVVIQYVEQYKGEIRHDRSWTTEAVFNILDNAVKYGKQGNQIIVTVRKLGTLLEIGVKDDNDPIPERERNRIFERFYRGQNSMHKEGVGIGLYLTREIIEKQGGYVSVSEQDGGNLFTVVLFL